jgi:hypothetical protein
MGKRLGKKCGIIKFQYFSKIKNKNFFRNSFLKCYLMDFSKKTWNNVERNTFHPNMLAFLEKILN